MPTGYTAAVATGEMTTLRDYALTCARGMGALIMMRDMPSDAPIPERFEPSDFYKTKLAEALVELVDLLAMEPEEWQAAADAEIAEQIKRAEAYNRGKDEQRARYDAMIAQVEAWQGAPEGLKEFMLQQLRDSRKFDCPEGNDWYQSLDPTVGADWFVARKKKLTEDIARYENEYREEVERTEARNAWVRQLRASLQEFEATTPNPMRTI